MATNPDGYLSYLKPGSTDWKALDYKSYIYWRDRRQNKTLEDAGTPIPQPLPLSEGENKKLKDNQAYVNEFLLKSLQFPNLSFLVMTPTY
ncbi:TPA: hypothetical protein R6P87_004353 [Klebsiella pneumoniae]|nr:hypothetical protein [Klebsiella pneumoniae]HED9535770.1 hypothetical protein [Klebsiella pneumoniae]